jgi:hypothetical protein
MGQEDTPGETIINGRSVHRLVYRDPNLQLHELQTELAERPARTIPFLAAHLGASRYGGQPSRDDE